MTPAGPKMGTYCIWPSCRYPEVDIPETVELVATFVAKSYLSRPLTGASVPLSSIFPVSYC